MDDAGGSEKGRVNSEEFTLIFVALLSLSNVCAVDVNLSEDDVVLNNTHYKNINLDNSDEYCNSNVKEVCGKNNNSQNSFSDVQKLIDDSEENDTIQLNSVDRKSVV